MSTSLSIEHNLKKSVNNQGSTISDIFLVLKCNNDISMRLASLILEVNALRKESDYIYKDFNKKKPDSVIDKDGELEEALTGIIETETKSLKKIQGFLKLIESPDYPFWLTKFLAYSAIRQQKKFIVSTDRLRTYVREHDVDAEDHYDGPFNNAKDLIDHLNS